MNLARRDKIHGTVFHVRIGPVGKLEAKPGARRIRRTIMCTLATGEQTTRQVIITDPDKARLLLSAALSLLANSMSDAMLYVLIVKMRHHSQLPQLV